jgi:hypothetical protein
MRIFGSSTTVEYQCNGEYSFYEAYKLRYGRYMASKAMGPTWSEAVFSTRSGLTEPAAEKLYSLLRVLNSLDISHPIAMKVPSVPNALRAFHCVGHIE